MTHKSLHLQLPKTMPFDKENWFESFIGNFVIPILDTGLIEKYWFSRYQDNELGKHVRFRFFIQSLDELTPLINDLLNKYKIRNLQDEEEYNYVSDLGSDRFLGDNKTTQNREHRADLIYNYLYSISQLFVNFLSYNDDKDYYYLENETKSKFNHYISFESLHHLFCNITECPLFVMELRSQTNDVIFSSETYAQGMVDNHKELKIVNRHNIRF